MSIRKMITAPLVVLLPRLPENLLRTGTWICSLKLDFHVDTGGQVELH